MKISSTLRAALVVLFALAGLSSANADEGTISLVIYKAGWIIGGSGGNGVLHFRGRSYGLSTGGIDYGLVFGGSRAVLRGRVSNIWRPSDIAGAYAAGGAGIVVGGGVRGILLTNARGVTLAHASTLEAKAEKGADKAAAARVGAMIAKRALDKGVTDVVFDRGGYLYHGRVKALADAAREAGLNF